MAVRGCKVQRGQAVAVARIEFGAAAFDEQPRDRQMVLRVLGAREMERGIPTVHVSAQKEKGKIK